MEEFRGELTKQCIIWTNSWGERTERLVMQVNSGISGETVTYAVQFQRERTKLWIIRTNSCGERVKSLKLCKFQYECFQQS